MSLSNLRNALDTSAAVDSSSNQAAKEHQLSIKCTGGKASLARIYKKKRDTNTYQVYMNIQPQISLKTSKDSWKSRDSRSIRSSKEENPIIFRSYNLYLIANQKQVGYIKHYLSSPIKSMKIFSFDSYPLFVESKHILFRVEVR